MAQDGRERFVSTWRDRKRKQHAKCCAAMCEVEGRVGAQAGGDASGAWMRVDRISGLEVVGNGVPGGKFGASVALSGNTVMVGDPTGDAPGHRFAGDELLQYVDGLDYAPGHGCPNYPLRLLRLRPEGGELRRPNPRCRRRCRRVRARSSGAIRNPGRRPHGRVPQGRAACHDHAQALAGPRRCRRCGAWSDRAGGRMIGW